MTETKVRQAYELARAIWSAYIDNFYEHGVYPVWRRKRLIALYTRAYERYERRERALRESMRAA